MDRMTLDELLKQHNVDPTTLPAAPDPLPDHEVRARITTRPLQPCAACGTESPMVRIVHTEQGSRWLDLCWEHGWAIHEPSPHMPTTMEGILSDLREVMAELAAETGTKASLRIWTDEAGWQDEHDG